tara:strand:- start:134 stop:430 length:297 start_codon:yes stop_codon:yes gene_type:complete
MIIDAPCLLGLVLAQRLSTQNKVDCGCSIKERFSNHVLKTYFMIKIDAKYFLVSGILFTYFGLKGDFNLVYNGLALLMAWASFFIAFMEFNKKRYEDD